MGRSRAHRSPEEVELNLAAMLDMAFQLLAFFIMTFKPAPMEGQINLRLPPPVGITAGGTEKPGETVDESKTPPGLSTLVISVFANPGNGRIAAMGVGETSIGTLPALEAKLQQVFADKGTPFDQIIVQVGGKLRYDELMKVVEVCTRQRLASGEKLSKLSFVEAPD
jgi:biopolymer transport protein ExbD